MSQTQRPPTLIPSVIAPAIQTGITSSPRLSERLWQRFATLGGRFRTLLIAIIVVTCLTALTISLSSSRAASNLNTIGTESIPSISAAQSIIPFLEDIDAHTADYLANPDSAFIPCTSSLTDQQFGSLSAHDCASKIIDLDQQTLNHYLFLAGQNATYPGSSTALEQTQAGLQIYIGDINLMRHEYALAANHSDPNDPAMQQAYQASRAAQGVLLQQDAGRSSEKNLPACTLNGEILAPQTWPAAGIETNLRCLSALGKPRLDNAYNDNVSFFGVSLGLVFGLSIYCCIFLAWATWSMVTTTRKLFNPGLLLALLLALVSTSVVLADFDSIYGLNGSFAVIKNAYNNVYTASALEQEAAQVQANQARWLTALSFHDLSGTSQWQQKEQASGQQVNTTLPAFVKDLSSSTHASLLATIQQDWKQYSAQVASVNQFASAPGASSSQASAEIVHLNAASTAFQILIGDIQQFNTASTSDYQGILQGTSARLVSLTTWWALIFPVLGILGAWGISRRLGDF